MSTEVWYRKWRPRSFSDTSGQEHVTRTLANAVAQGRVAHAYLLCGPRGTGKTTTARVLAKAVNCANPRNGEPCNGCESCRAVDEGRALDLVEMDAASNRGIDDIRQLRDRVGYHPTDGRYRVYLIDEVHELTAQAFDALLKTLEEPPAHVIFVLATTDAHKVPATIISRCQRFDLVRVRHADIVSRLQHIAQAEGVQADAEALGVVAGAANGGLRDAVNLLEQLVASQGTVLTEARARAGLGLVSDERALEFAVAAATGNFAGGLGLIAAVQDDGVEMRAFTREVVGQLRALLLVRAGAESGLDGLGADDLAGVRRAAATTDTPALVRALRAFTATEFRGDVPAALPVELALAEATGIVTEQTVSVAAPSAPPRIAPTPAPVRAPSSTREAPVPAVAHQNGMAARPEPAVAAPEALPNPDAPPPAAIAPVQPSEVAATAGEVSVEDEGAHVAPLLDEDRTPEAASLSASQVDQRVTAHEASEQREAVPAGGTPATLDDARALFRTVFDTWKAMRVPVSGVLNSGCDIVAYDGRSIRFGFRFPVHVDKVLPGTAAHRTLTEAVSQVFGKQLDVQCVHDAGVIDRLKAMPPRTSHLLDEARRLGFQPVQRG